MKTSTLTKKTIYLRVIYLLSTMIFVVSFTFPLVNVEAKERQSTDFSNSQKFNGKNFSVLPKNKKIPVTFKKKIDGDTFRVLLNKKEIKVRLLLVDTPESVKQGTAVQPFALEASDFTEKLLVNAKKIDVEFDKGDRTDRYNRALCYVYVDNKLLQSKLLENGLARVAFVYKPNTTYLKEFKEVEKQAKIKELKIWSKKGYVTKKGFKS